MRGIVDGLNTSEGKRRLRGELSITPLLAGLLAACGGGSTKYIAGPSTGQPGTGPGPSGTPDPTPPDPTPPGPTPPGPTTPGPTQPGPSGRFDALPFDVYVNDGVVEGATVWVDMNDNGRIDEGDINLGKTDQNGRLADVSGEHAGKRIIVDLRGARDLFTGERFSLTQELYYTAMSDERGGSDVVASPISTILEALRSLDGNADATDEELLAKIFEDTGVTVELDDLNNVDNFIHPAREQDQTFPTGSINALRDTIATTSIRLQLLLEELSDEDNTNVEAAKRVDKDGFNPIDDLTMENRQEAQTRIAEAIERAGGEPVANPNPGGLPLTTPEDIELTLPMDVWGFRDPTGNTPGTESSFTELRIMSITVPTGTDTGALVDADGTEYRAGNTVPADKISGLKYRPPTNVHGEVRIVFRVNDGQVESDDATLTLTITSVNDVPTDIVLSGDRDAAAERELYVLNNGRIVATDGTVAGLLTAADVETNAGVASGAQTGLTYRLGGTHGNLFEIVSVGGNSRLQLKGDVTALNPGQIYTLTITVTDANGGSYTETFNIVQGGLYVTPQGVTQTDGTERVYSDSPTGLVNEEASGATNPIQVGTVRLEGLRHATDADASGAKQVRYRLVSGEGDDDNDDFTLNIGTGALSYTGSDSGDYEAGGANHQPDDLSIRVRVDYYAVARQAASFAGERFVDATGDRTDTDTREFAYSGGTISMPNAYATYSGSVIGFNGFRIVSKMAGPRGNNIEIHLVYDASRAGGTSLLNDQALGIQVRGDGTTERPYIITIYTTLGGIRARYVKAAIEEHNEQSDLGELDTALANDLVTIIDRSTPNLILEPGFAANNNLITMSLAGAAEAPYHVAAGRIHFGDETIDFAEAHVSPIAGSDTIIIVALGDHDDDDATPDTWQVQAVATLPEGDRFFVLGTIADDDVRISGGNIRLHAGEFAGVNYVPNGNLAASFWAKTAGSAGNFIEVRVVYDANRVAGATDNGVAHITVTGGGTSASDKYIITIYTVSNFGTTNHRIREAIEAHTQRGPGDTAAANDLITVRTPLDIDVLVAVGTTYALSGGGSGTAFTVSAGTIFDGGEIIHFAGATFSVPDSDTGRNKNKLILRLGDHDSNPATPATWQLELVDTLPTLSSYYLLADTLVPPATVSVTRIFDVPYSQIEATDIQVATQNLGTDIAYTAHADASGNLRDDDARTFSYSGGVITQTDSGTQDEVNVRVAAGTLYLSGGVVINFDALPTTLVTEHSYVIVDDVNGDGRYTLRIVTKLPSSSTPANDKYYVLGSISPNGERLEGGVLEVSPTGFGRHTESAGGNLLHVLSAKTAGTDNAFVT
ncbi:MAG: hypothetical protein OXU76_03950, partial [Alphaproteobacteria bacterium]|nr:hypothetical protein [Alphaproteobacteria bacterium]